VEEWYYIEKLGVGVYALIDVEGGWFRSNTGLVDMGSYTLIVDTQYNEARTRGVLEAAESLGLPGRFIVFNTHHHGDHAFGNHVIPGPAVMHERAAEAVRLLAPLAPTVYEGLFPQLDFRGARYTTPEVTFRDRLWFEGERGRAEARYYGPAHSVGDSILVVPWARVVFAGDLVFNRVVPLLVDGSVAEWGERLERLRLEYRGWTIVGGHGPPASTHTLDKLIEYAQHLIHTAANLQAASPLEAALRASNGPLEGWKCGERLVLNLARAQMDLQAKPPGEPPATPEELAKLLKEYLTRTKSKPNC
jgi:cyclase